MKKQNSFRQFLQRDTLSVEFVMVVNCFMELEVINPEHEVHGKMLHNEVINTKVFTSVTVQENNSVMLSSLGSTLG
jgi:phosphoribosylformylglycinamidine synthase